LKQAIPPLGSHCQRLSETRVGIRVGERVVVTDKGAVADEVAVAVKVGSGTTTPTIGVDPGPLQPVWMSHRINTSMKRNGVILKANFLPLFYLLV
jgi:hypothetical protein